MKRIQITAFVLGLLFVFPATAARAGGADMQTGELGGAQYRIQVPDEWNGNLVMYAHAYRPRGASWSPLADVFGDVFLDRGFALAESGYSLQGWAVAEAVRETEELRRHFAKVNGEPDSTFIAGHSLGGVVTIATIETYADHYDGALPICAPLVPALQFFKSPVFDMLVTFEVLFGDELPDGRVPVIDSPTLPKAEVKAAMDAKPEIAAEFAARWEIRSEDIAGIVSMNHMLYKELAERAGGNFIDNKDTVYQKYQAVPNINGSVRRYAADTKAVEYVKEHYTPTGRIEDPVLAVHTTYDPGVPPRLPSQYDLTVSLMGNEKLFVQKYVNAEGHCAIGPVLMGRAFDQLRAWTATGKRPEAGVIKRR
jgi:pimeloyl-ACP methyl ester carboxylesterase